MSSTLTEKILAKKSGFDKVKPNELIEAEIDLILCHDVTTPPAIDMLEKRGINEVFNSNKIVVTPDHFVPNKDIKSAELAKKLREWVRKKDIKQYYELGEHGICHAILPEKGHILPGTLVIGADSHACTHGAFGAFATGVGSTDLAAAIYSGKLWFKVPETIKIEMNGTLMENVYSKDVILEIIKNIGVDGATYKSLEFTGYLLKDFSMEARMTITNMAIEMGGKAGLMNPDKKTISYIKEKTKGKFNLVSSDENAIYSKELSFDFSCLEPVVATPHLPSNVKTAKECSNIKIDQAYLGSCTNGRLEDLEIAAEIMKGNRVKRGTRMIIVPATTEVYKEALKKGLIEIFIESGAVVSAPTCGACLGGHMGILARGERCISSTNRNFVGRMGHPESEVYLASPATVASSAVVGNITDPNEVQ